MARKCAFTNFTLKRLSLHLYQLNMTQAEPQYWSEPEGFQWLQWEKDTASECFISLLLNQLNCTLKCLLGILVFTSEFPYTDFLSF